MKSYKEYTKAYLGGSDIASITLRSGSKAGILEFGEDGSYSAYIVDEEAKIGSHYSEVFRCQHWLWTYDDEGTMNGFDADEIIIYRAGMRGCIIQLIGERK